VNIDQALRKGLRGLRPGSSLARLLDQHRGKRNRKQLPRYTIRQILGWADAFHRRTGRWPTSDSGAIRDTNGETWMAVDVALRNGQRGLPGGSSLAQLLFRKRKIRNRSQTPRLTMKQILAWCDAHHRRTGMWPRAEDGPIHGQPGETWKAVDSALKHKSRGLRVRSTIFKLLQKHRGKRSRRADLPGRSQLRCAAATTAGAA
jgi:hypothetical protein